MLSGSAFTNVAGGTTYESDVCLTAADGSTTDASFLISDATNISQGVFDVTSTVGSDLSVTCTAGTQPTGLTLDAFTASWAGGVEAAVPVTSTMALATEEVEIGASLTIDRTTASTGTAVALPYTVSVTFQ